MSFDETIDQIFDDKFDRIFEEGFEDCINDYNEHQAAKQATKSRIHIESGKEAGYIQLWKDYFSEQPNYPDNMFRRRFRMSKRLFMRIVERLSNEVPFFKQRPYPTGRLGFHVLQKCTAVIHLLAYGVAPDAIDEYLRMSASTSRICLQKFVVGVIQLFENEYLRRPSPEDLQRLLHIREFQGFPGMIGSIDCMHWEWKNCPTAWKGQYSRGHEKPTIVLEAVASQDLWIWHAFFGPPGTCNDINVLDRSPVFDDILEGRAPPVNYVVNGRQYHMAYYLTDGIYPKWATFIQSISRPQNEKSLLFANYQEAVRKDVERAFGVLQARFAIVRNPSLCLDKAKIVNIMRACIILHNMIVEGERDQCTQYDLSEFELEEGSGTSHMEFTYSTETPTNVNNMMANRAQIREERMHNQLKAYLVEHIWQNFGRNENYNVL